VSLVERSIRQVLWLGAFFNAVVAASILFPAAFGLPPPPAGSDFAIGILAWFVALFGVAYAWMAMQPAIPRPLVALAAIGKAGVFAMASACLWRGAIELPTFVVCACDLAFAAWFVAWLRATRR
jgi:hypothetical protein